MLGMSIFAIVCILLSIIVDYRKTLHGFRKGIQMFTGILPSLINVLLLVSLFLTLVPESTLISWLGAEAGFKGYVASALLGSIALIPGFIAFPLCATLYKNGVNLTHIAVFITTLMMVGLLTIPVEKNFFGLRIAVVRNLLSFIGALLIGAAMGLYL